MWNCWHKPKREMTKKQITCFSLAPTIDNNSFISSQSFFFLPILSFFIIPFCSSSHFPFNFFCAVPTSIYYYHIFFFFYSYVIFCLSILFCCCLGRKDHVLLRKLGFAYYIFLCFKKKKSI